MNPSALNTSRVYASTLAGAGARIFSAKVS